MNNILPISTTPETNSHSRLIQEEKSEVKKKENSYVALPDNWWDVSTSYPKDDSVAKIRNSVRRNHNGKLDKKYYSRKIVKGDHRVNEPYRKDYVYYRELKNKILKYSVYPALLFVGTIVYLLANVFASL